MEKKFLLFQSSLSISLFGCFQICWFFDIRVLWTYPFLKLRPSDKLTESMAMLTCSHCDCFGLGSSRRKRFLDEWANNDDFAWDTGVERGDLRQKWLCFMFNQKLAPRDLRTWPSWKMTSWMRLLPHPWPPGSLRGCTNHAWGVERLRFTEYLWIVSYMLSVKKTRSIQIPALFHWISRWPSIFAARMHIPHITEPRWPRWRYLLDLPGDCLGISNKPTLVCSGRVRCPEHGRLNCSPCAKCNLLIHHCTSLSSGLLSSLLIADPPFL